MRAHVVGDVLEGAGANAPSPVLAKNPLDLWPGHGEHHGEHEYQTDYRNAILKSHGRNPAWGLPIYDALSDLAVLEEFRRALNYDDGAFQMRLKVKKSQLGVWRKRNHIPVEQRQKMLTFLNSARTPGEQAQEALRALDGVRSQLQRLLGPLPGADSGASGRVRERA